MGVGVCLGAGPPGWSRADEVCRVAVDGVGRSVARALVCVCAVCMLCCLLLSIPVLTQFPSPVTFAFAA